MLSSAVEPIVSLQNVILYSSISLGCLRLSMSTYITSGCICLFDYVHKYKSQFWTNREREMNAKDEKQNLLQTGQFLSEFQFFLTYLSPMILE